MAKLIIADLFQNGDFFEQLTKEELQMNVVGGATAAGSISAGQYSQKGDVVGTTAVTATVATSDPRPFRIDLEYSFKPRLYVAARVSYI
ncbi:MAG: hypothetical protein WBM44_11705 [Waterburya sp.]